VPWGSIAGSGAGAGGGLVDAPRMSGTPVPVTETEASAGPVAVAPGLGLEEVSSGVRVGRGEGNPGAWVGLSSVPGEVAVVVLATLLAQLGLGKVHQNQVGV
jgi:hypothetical protein